jgi:hypothetical protein
MVVIKQGSRSESISYEGKEKIQGMNRRWEEMIGVGPFYMLIVKTGMALYPNGRTITEQEIQRQLRLQRKLWKKEAGR